MIKLNTIFLSGTAALAATGCQTTGAYDEKTSTDGEATEMVLAQSDGWPREGCPSASDLRTWLANPGNQSNMAYFGFYSDGRVFWLGSEHGANVYPPNKAFQVPRNKQPYVMRWNIDDSPPGGTHIGQNYAYDHDATRDGEYAVSALAINQCETDQDGNWGSCDQPQFGQTAWEEDGEFCPPIILSEDPSSIYLWDKNENTGLPQVYDYSVALILKSSGPNDKKAGMRIILDPRVKNGGGGN